MSLNLVNRSNNYYLQEIDAVQSELTDLKEYVFDSYGNNILSLSASGVADIAASDFYLSKHYETVTITRNSNIVFTTTNDNSVLEFEAIDLVYRPTLSDQHFVILGGAAAESSYLLIVKTTGVITLSQIGSSRFFPDATEITIPPFSVTYISE